MTTAYEKPIYVPNYIYFQPKHNITAQSIPVLWSCVYNSSNYCISAQTHGGVPITERLTWDTIFPASKKSFLVVLSRRLIPLYWSQQLTFMCFFSD